MNRQGYIQLIRTLTRLVVEQLCPGKWPTFEEDFAAWALGAGVPQVSEKIEPWHREQALDTTLVAGMFFQVLVQAENLPRGIPERVSFVRREAKNFLVQRLAGQITLAQFFRLLNLIEENVQGYFEGLADDWRGRGTGTRQEPPPAPPLLEAVDGEKLGRVLSQLPLPAKGRRITRETLGAFLSDTKGEWFRLIDMENHFQVNKKTAWSYLHLLLQAKVLEHNGQKANRVRYALAASFRRGAGPGAASPE